MTKPSLRLAFVISIAASSLALDVPVSAQLADGRLGFNAHPLLEFVQFGDSWGDRSSYQSDFFDPYWGGGRRSPRPSHQYHPDHSNDSYNPSYRRPQPLQQVYEPIKPPPPRKVETAPAQTVWSSAILRASGWRMGLNWYLRKRRKLASYARSGRT